MFGFGRGFGRWFGWWGGRGFGWGARLGYCPWTGMPRGWRWMQFYGYTPYSPAYYWTPGTTYTAAAPAYGVEDVNVLKAQAEALREEIKRIEERIRQLEEQGR